jgi:glycerophosphoryl diester phosphodiesterase
MFAPVVSFAGKVSSALLAAVQFLLAAFGIPSGVAPVAAANPYIVSSGTAWVSAHRLGAGLAPENTLMAVQNCVGAKNFKANILEMDVQLTKDGELVLLHNTSFDSTGNAAEAFGHSNVMPVFYTYGALYEKINLGSGWDAPWAALRGDKIPHNLRVTRLREVLVYTEAHASAKKPYYYTIEAKQPSLLGYGAVDQIVAVAKELGILERVLLGSFYPDVSAYISRKYPRVARAADTADVLAFAGAFQSNADLKELKPGYRVLVLPYGESTNWFFDFGRKEVVDYAHKYGLAVHYWTVNNAEDAKYLSSIGADSIITDEPAAVYQALYQK